ncbi:MAG: hypothetical protein ACP5P3_00745 [Ignavibacteria bacterium]
MLTVSTVKSGATVPHSFQAIKNYESAILKTVWKKFTQVQGLNDGYMDTAFTTASKNIESWAMIDNIPLCYLDDICNSFDFHIIELKK